MNFIRFFKIFFFFGGVGQNTGKKTRSPVVPRGQTMEYDCGRVVGRN